MAIPSYTNIDTSAAVSPGKTGIAYSGEIREHAVANENIPFGYAGYVDTDGLFKNLVTGELSQASTRNSFGIALFSENANGLDNNRYEQYDMASIGKFGYFSVVTEEDVTPGDAVRVRHVTNGAKVIGMFCTNAEANKTALLGNARYVSYRAAGDKVAIVFIPPVVTLTADT